MKNILKSLFGVIFVGVLFYSCSTPTEYIIETEVVYDTLSTDTTYIVIGDTEGVYAIYSEASLVQWPNDDPDLGIHYFMQVTRVDSGSSVNTLVGHGALFVVDTLWNPIDMVEHSERIIDIETGDSVWTEYTTGDASFYGEGRYTYEETRVMVAKFWVEERDE